jgi:hypothetical protein
LDRFGHPLPAIARGLLIADSESPAYHHTAASIATSADQTWQIELRCAIRAVRP